MEAIKEQATRLQIETPFTQWEGTIITAISGSISAISSGLIIFVIFRSKGGLKTSFHRLMLGMSVMDILESCMMVITTLPMPKDMIYQQFLGISIGNNFTCQMQAAIVNGAGLGTLAYNAALCAFFLCQIGFQFDAITIKRKVEPILHIVCVGAAISLSVLGVIGQFYNPSPYQSWCSVSTFPFWCTGNGVGSGVVAGDSGSLTDFNECSLGSKAVADFQAKVALYLFCLYVLIFTVIILSMLFIMFLVIRRHALLKKYISSVYGSRLDSSHGGRRQVGGNKSVRRRRTSIAQKQINDLIEEAEKDRKNTNVVLTQCVAYIFACLLVQIFPMLNFNVSKTNELYTNYAYDIALIIIFPLQGFFNFIIFISHKMYSLKQHDGGLTLCQTFTKALTTRDHPIIVLSNVSLVSIREIEEEYDDSPEDHEEEPAMSYDAGEYLGDQEQDDQDLSYDATHQRAAGKLEEGGIGAFSRSSRDETKAAALGGTTSAHHPHQQSEELLLSSGVNNDAFEINSRQPSSHLNSTGLSMGESRSKNSQSSLLGWFSYATGQKSENDDVSKAISSL